MATADLSAERLRELLHYDQTTGAFTWRVFRGRTAKAGDQAGSIVDGYVKIMVDGRTYTAGRLAVVYVTGAWPASEVDHRDTDRSNNRWLNLRDVPHATNVENQRSARVTNKVGFLGVSKHHRSERYRARIRVAGKLKPLGWFDTPEDAHEAYKAAKRLFHDGNTL
jgi:hypothetical protein